MIHPIYTVHTSKRIDIRTVLKITLYQMEEGDCLITF